MADWESNTWNAKLIYILMIAGFFVPGFLLASVIFASVCKNRTDSDFLRSHYVAQTHIFWVFFVVWIVVFVLFLLASVHALAVLFAFIAMIVNYIYALVASYRGLTRLSAGANADEDWSEFKEAHKS